MSRTGRRPLLAPTATLVAVLVLVVGCVASSDFPPSPASESITSPTPAPRIATEPAATGATATPSSCSGSTCTLRGVVYAGGARAGNGLPGVEVNLTHHSNCSPTRGEYETVSAADGSFEFRVYLHDTDTLVLEAQKEGYRAYRIKVGGFDCLSCRCSPVEIVLSP